MGRLTDDMTRLADELGAMHQGRETFIEDVRKEVTALRDRASEMQARFREAHGEMAAKTKADLAGFVSDVKDEVAGLQNRFRQKHTEMAKKTKADNMAFLSGVKEAVDGVKNAVATMRCGFAEDIAGGRKAWFGLSSAGQPTVQEKGPQPATKGRKSKKAKGS